MCMYIYIYIYIYTHACWLRALLTGPPPAPLVCPSFFFSWYAMGIGIYIYIYICLCICEYISINKLINEGDDNGMLVLVWPSLSALLSLLLLFFRYRCRNDRKGGVRIVPQSEENGRRPLDRAGTGSSGVHKGGFGKGGFSSYVLLLYHYC